MDSTITVDVAHGLTLSKIRSVNATIRGDDSTGLFPLTPGYISTPTEVDAYIQLANNTIITLSRRTGGVFDTVDYDSTSFNRGWITITYVG